MAYDYGSLPPNVYSKLSDAYSLWLTTQGVGVTQHMGQKWCDDWVKKNYLGEVEFEDDGSEEYIDGSL